MEIVEFQPHRHMSREQRDSAIAALTALIESVRAGEVSCFATAIVQPPDCLYQVFGMENDPANLSWTLDRIQFRMHQDFEDEPQDAS